jgi:hypothetical protein
MWRHCRRNATALSMRCDSAVDHVTALSMQCDSAVDHVTALSMRCDSAVDHVTALLIMWQHCWWLNNVEFKKKENPPKCEISNAWAWCDSTVDVMWQCCQSCNSAIIKVIEKTVSSLNWQWLCCNCVSWFLFVLAYITGLFLHSQRHSGDPFQLTQWTNFPQTVGRCRPKNWSKSKTCDRLYWFFLFFI